MSGDVCKLHPAERRQTSHQISPQSRIPIISPLPLRRWGSLRGRCEGNSHPFNKNPKTSPDSNLQNGVFGRGLQRGYSFMERGEKRRDTNGVRPATTAASRPTTANTEPRNKGALTRAAVSGGTPHKPTRNRSLSLSLCNARGPSPRSPLVTFPKTPPSSPDTRHQQYRDWDLDSVTSTTSGLSLASCDHASVAHNGTTFSGRSKRYVVHCSEHSGMSGDDYLTPTQRAHKEVKRLKYLLQQTQKELDSKDTDILRLTKEVVELRLYKAALNSPEDKSNSSSDAVTVREVNINEEDLTDGIVENNLGGDGEHTSSCADSGHYDDLTNSSVHSKDSVNIGEDISLSPYKAKTPVETADKGISVDLGPRDSHSEHQRLIVEYERRLQELVRSHEEECHQMKQKHNDKVDELLQRLSEVNTRYWEIIPDLDSAKERIKELEQQLEEACKKLVQQESKHKETYLKMYNQGQEAAKLEVNNQFTDAVHENPSRISVTELLHQLEVTQTELDNVKDLEYASTSNSMQPLLSAKEAVSLWVLGARKAMYRQLLEARSKNKIDPEITLQFLKSAIYYFLTDKENNQGHLRAILSILGFTPNEISNIDKARFT